MAGGDHASPAALRGLGPEQIPAIAVCARAGVVAGLAATGAVITSAGLVLAGTSAAPGVLPGTLIVRSALVTSLFLDMGPKVGGGTGRPGGRRGPAVPRAVGSRFS